MVTKAIILVAGMGKRLRPLTLETHKCLTEIKGIPIIINALTCLDSLGIKETTLVVGYLAEKIETAVGNQLGQMRITYIENSSYADTNTAYSLELGLRGLEKFDNAYILEGDVYFEPALLTRLCESVYDNVTVLEKYNPTLDGSFVEIGDQRFVTDWIHKSCRTKEFSFKDKHKTVNLHKFARIFVDNILLPTLHRVNEAKAGNAPLEIAMQSIVHENPHTIYGLDTGGLRWVEIDDVNDLKLAQRIFGDDEHGNSKGFA